MVACGIRPSHSARVSAVTGAKQSNTGSSLLPAIISTVVALLPCIRFTKHDVICDQDCCSCVSLSPTTATPQWFAYDTVACAVRQPSPPWHRRFAVDFPETTKESKSTTVDQPRNRLTPPESCRFQGLCWRLSCRYVSNSHLL